MTIEEATKLLKMSDQAIWLKGLEKEQKEATEMAIKSLEAWEKVKEEINSMPNIIYKWHAVEIIDKHLAEVEK